MQARTPVIGIPQWEWKSKLLKYAKKHPDVYLHRTDGLCYECHRHFELLDAIDKGTTDFSKTQYFKYQFKKHKPEQINKKIQNFIDLYEDIKKNGCKNPAIVTDDGCRLDGSHRLAILIHLKIDKAPINIMRYESLFDDKKSKEIRNQVNIYRKQTYGL